jgi:hypothetical protein
MPSATLMAARGGPGEMVPARRTMYSCKSVRRRVPVPIVTSIASFFIRVSARLRGQPCAVFLPNRILGRLVAG